MFAGKSDEELRTLAQRETMAELEIRRQRWRCAKCRIIVFPLDDGLELGTEGYNPLVLTQAVRQASKAASFSEARDDLRELAKIEISPMHLQRVSERIGKEWAQSRDRDVKKFRQLQLKRTHKEVPPGAAVRRRPGSGTNAGCGGPGRER
jgi:hypothetical protein